MDDLRVLRIIIVGLVVVALGTIYIFFLLLGRRIMLKNLVKNIEILLLITLVGAENVGVVTRLGAVNRVAQPC